MKKFIDGIMVTGGLMLFPFMGLCFILQMMGFNGLVEVFTMF